MRGVSRHPFINEHSIAARYQFYFAAAIRLCKTFKNTLKIIFAFIAYLLLNFTLSVSSALALSEVLCAYQFACQPTAAHNLFTIPSLLCRRFQMHPSPRLAKNCIFKSKYIALCLNVILGSKLVEGGCL